VRTTSIAPSGEAVAHWEAGGERRAVLIRGAAPGEAVRVRVDPSARPARGELVAVVEPGPGRVDAPCPHVAACGGCDWMHLSRRAQREQHLSLAAGVAAGAPVRFHASPRAAGYRTRARLHARGGRDGALVGFFGARSRSIVSVDACLVLDRRLDAARAALGALLRGARGDGEIGLALGRDQKPVADVRWSGDLVPEVFARLESETSSGRFAGFSVTCGDARRPAVIGDPTPWIAGADGAPLELAPGGFAQANEEVNRALAARVAEIAAGGRRPLELFAGAGNFTVLLARDAPSRVRAVEASEAACEAARRNLRARSLECRVTCADAETFEVPAGTDVVVLDPPRTGARGACGRVAAKRSVRRVVYVSCDRATLARDAAILAPRFRVASVDVFEMFPHTSHVETLVAFEDAAR
jgi:23S rRNA (uracil1939-C5)-methyltransferase